MSVITGIAGRSLSARTRRRSRSARKTERVKRAWRAAKRGSSMGRHSGLNTDFKILAELALDEKAQALRSRNKRDLFVLGVLNPTTRELMLWRGDWSRITVPLSAFKQSGDGTRPDWSDFKIIDFGHTLRFGKYEAAADALLYERDPDYRRRLRQKTG